MWYNKAAIFGAAGIQGAMPASLRHQAGGRRADDEHRPLQFSSWHNTYKNRAGPFGVGVCPVVFLMDGSLRRVQRTHGFLGVFHQVQQACRVAGVVLGQALGA